MQKVLDYYRYNPNATPVEVMSYFEGEFEVAENTRRIKEEVAKNGELRAKLRPLYGQRLEVEEKMKYAISDMEMEVYLEYPPRQGSDAQREALRNKLKKENMEYTELNGQFRALNITIGEIEDELKDIEQGAKNARRMLELFGYYIQFLNEFAKGR